MTVDLTFSDYLKAFRERAGLTQEDLAERAGLSRDAISALERGRRSRPHPPTINALGRALNLTEDELIRLRSSSRSPVSGPHSLVGSTTRRIVPESLTLLVGREEELADLEAMLTSGSVRLVTVTGPGGVGKTRLSLELMRRMQSRLSDQMAYVPMGVIWDASLVLPTIAEAVGVHNPGATSLPLQIAGVLADRPFLLVLDNMEHLLDAGEAVSTLVRTCPTLTILVTSRSPLRVSIEHEYPLQPLAVDQACGLAEAVDLFETRAQASRPEFSRTPSNIQTIESICLRLDGLPLAIELAAARIKVLSPEALLTRLNTGIDVLRGGPRDHDARLQSVRSAIAWSYDLLDEQDRAVFRALSVFVGEFSLHDAEVLLATALGLEPADTLDALASLIDKSLVRNVEPDAAEPRYALLFTIRSFAIAELESSPTGGLVHRAHAMHVLDVVEMAAHAFRNKAGADQLPWFNRLELERGNWRAALSWLHEHGETEALLRLTTGLSWFWYVRGPVTEGRFWGQRAVAMQHDGVAPEFRSRALVGKGLLDLYSGNLAEARATLIESLKTAPEPPEQWWQASAELFLGMTATGQGDYAFALEHLEQAMDGYRQIPHSINESIALGYLAAATWGTGSIEPAIGLCEKAARSQRQHQDVWGLGQTLGYLALMQSERGEHQLALIALRENLEIRRDGLFLANPDDDRQHGPQWEAGVWDDVAVSLAILGVLLVSLDREDAAAYWFGVVDAIRASIGGLNATLPEKDSFIRAEDAARNSLGNATFSAQFRAGQGMSLHVALDDAIEQVEILIEQESGKRGPESAGANPGR